MPEEENKENEGSFRRICPQCKTSNYYLRKNAGEVSHDGGETYHPVDTCFCKTCKQDYMETEMLVEKYMVGKFESKRDGKTKFVHMHKDWRMKQHERRKARKQKEGRKKDDWILKQLKRKTK
jgi:hypothetical protein